MDYEFIKYEELKIIKDICLDIKNLKNIFKNHNLNYVIGENFSIACLDSQINKIFKCISVSKMIINIDLFINYLESNRNYICKHIEKSENKTIANKLISNLIQNLQKIKCKLKLEMHK